jgi:hypothetical protein
MIESVRLRVHGSAISRVIAFLALAITSDAFSQAAADRFAGVTPGPAGQIRVHGAVRYIAPAGWSVKSGADGVTTLSGRVGSNELPCEIWMLPPMSIRGDLATHGTALVAGTAAAKKFGPYRDDRGGDVRRSREEGISGTGWAYTDLSGQLGNSGITVRVLMARMGKQVLPIIGYSRTWNCLGNQSVRDNDVWALLFHSLQLPGHAQDSPQLGRQLIGTWSSTSGSAGNTEFFSRNGRFGSVALYQSYEASTTPGMVWEVDRSWQGDGPYEVHGDRLHTQDAKAGDSERNVTRLFSIVRTPSDKKPGGFDWVLRMVERSYNGSQTWGFSPSGNFVTHMTLEGRPQR